MDGVECPLLTCNIHGSGSDRFSGDVGKYSGGAARTAARTENQARGDVRSAAVFPVLTVVRNGRDSTHELTTIAHFPIEDSGSAPEEITQQERSKIPG